MWQATVWLTEPSGRVVSWSPVTIYRKTYKEVVLRAMQTLWSARRCVLVGDPREHDQALVYHLAVTYVQDWKNKPDLVDSSESKPPTIPA